jgi:hypothetical protein
LGASGHTILAKNMRRIRTQSLYTRRSHNARGRDDAEDRGEDGEGNSHGAKKQPKKVIWRGASGWRLAPESKARRQGKRLSMTQFGALAALLYATMGLERC